MKNHKFINLVRKAQIYLLTKSKSLNQLLKINRIFLKFFLIKENKSNPKRDYKNQIMSSQIENHIKRAKIIKDLTFPFANQMMRLLMRPSIIRRLLSIMCKKFVWIL